MEAFEREIVAPREEGLFTKGDLDLLAYDMPISRLIEQDSIRTLQEEEDELFITFQGVSPV